MRALVMDEDSSAKIATVVQTAIEYPIDREQLQAAIEGRKSPVGDNDNHVCYIPSGFRCVYSHEEQPKGWMRHLSISVGLDGDGSWPHPAAVGMLMEAFGFKMSLEEATVYREDEFEAINVLELI